MPRIPNDEYCITVPVNFVGAAGPHWKLTEVVTLAAFSVAAKLLLETEMADWLARSLSASVMQGVKDIAETPLRLKACEIETGV
jgi:hypothetical protein